MNFRDFLKKGEQAPTDVREEPTDTSNAGGEPTDTSGTQEPTDTGSENKE